MEYSIFQNFQYFGCFSFFLIFNGIFHIPKFSIFRMFCYVFVIFEINILKNIYIYHLKLNFWIFLEYCINFNILFVYGFFLEYSIFDIFIFHGIVYGIFRWIFNEIFQFKLVPYNRNTTKYELTAQKYWHLKASNLCKNRFL